MSLSALIRKTALRDVATATVATFATEGDLDASTVADVATVAVANPVADVHAPIVESESAKVATATLATLATARPHNPRSVATVATVTVANPAREQTNAPTVRTVSVEELIEAAMLACDHHGDGEAAREQMRADCIATPAHLRADLREHFLRSYPAKKPENGDERHACVECKHLHGDRCGNWRAAGVALRAWDAQLPCDLLTLPQRCPGFTVAVAADGGNHD